MSETFFYFLQCINVDFDLAPENFMFYLEMSLEYLCCSFSYRKDSLAVLEVLNLITTLISYDISPSEIQLPFREVLVFFLTSYVDQ